MSRWGQSEPERMNCSICTYNFITIGYLPCESCKQYMCEACFQFRKQCCDNMTIVDARTGELRVPDMFVKKEIANKVQNPHLHTIQCQSIKCMYRSTFGKYPNPSIINREYRFCPMCGSDAVVTEYDTDEYWKLLANKYNIPANILKSLYDIWDRKENERFQDFVAAFTKEALTT